MARWISYRRPAVVLSLLILALGSPALAQSVEDRRLDREAFLEGLRQRGLTDLLQMYLQETPLDDPVQSLLLAREVKLADFANASLPQAERQTALLEADRLLRQILADNPTDPRIHQWRLDLARSLLYQEAEPHCLSVLYRGGSESDRARIAALMDEALTLFDTLLIGLTEELARADNLPLREYERIEKQGTLEHWENVLLQAEYDRRWAVYYRNLVRPPSDPQRVEHLAEMLRDLNQETDLLTIPHSVSHYQCQSLLLAGMTARLLGTSATALTYLTEAIQVADSVVDPIEKDRLHWAATLARLEHIRTLSDAGDFDGALRAIDGFLSRPASSGDAGGLRLSLALLAVDVRHRHADRLLTRGDRPQAEAARAEAWQPLMDLSRQDTSYRNEIYAILYERLGRQADPARLHPFEQCALLAGLLADAEKLKTSTGDAQAADRITLLDRAIAGAEPIWRSSASHDPTLQAEIGYNLAVALWERGRLADSARQFLQVVERYSQSPLAPSAVESAVQIAAELYRQPNQERDSVRSLYLNALRALSQRFPESNANRYWRFFLAQLLEETGQYDEAAAEYERVAPDHEHYLLSRYLRTRALLAHLESSVGDGSRSVQEIKSVADAVTLAAQRFRETLNEPPNSFDGTDSETRQRLLADTALFVAEAKVIPGIGGDPGAPGQALEELANFESRYPAQQKLVPRVLKTRLTAYVALDRVEDARTVLPAYVAADPEHAPATLQLLLDRLPVELDKGETSEPLKGASPKAELALVLAEELMRGASRPDSSANQQSLYLQRLQLAEAQLGAGRFVDARALFEQCLTEDQASSPEGVARDLRIVYGLAETIYRAGEFDSALRLFDRIFRESSDRDRRWWIALLRNLQCHTELKHPPADIIRSIQQQRFLNPDMGGDDLRQQFDELEKRNQARQPG